MVKEKDEIIEKEEKIASNDSVQVIEKTEQNLAVEEEKEDSSTVVEETQKSPAVVEETQKSPTVVKEMQKSPTLETENTVKQEKKSLNTLSLFAILLISFLLIVLIAFFTFSFLIKNNTNIYSGIHIKNVDVSELSKDDAKNKINEYIKTSIPQEIILKHGDYETALNTSELGINFDINSAINIAYKFGRNDNLVYDGFEVLTTLFSNKNVEPTLSVDDNALTKLLKDISSKLPDKVIDSGYYIDGKNLIINKGSAGKIINISKTSQKIKDAIKDLNLINNKIEIYTEDATPKELDINAIYKDVHKDAVNASFTKSPRSFTPSKNGIDFAISLDEAKSKLSKSQKECTIPLKVVYPKVTTNMIGTEAFPNVLSQFSTNYYASNVNRTTNLKLAARKINGTVVMPGETFSYNDVVGARTIAAGYKEAPIYVNGKVEDGLGGGICQITSTLYNAVVLANLKIVYRTNHAFVPSYVGAGRDATVVYGAIDFKFKNNRDYPIKLIASVSSGVASFKILGLKTSNDYQVQISSSITSQTASRINSVTYKILKKNGKVVDRVLLSRDSYKRH